MAQSNSQLLRDYFAEVLNGRRLDLLPNYLSTGFCAHGTPYVGVGVMIDEAGGAKIIVRQVHPGGPAEGKLVAGDEILRISDGEHTWQTLDELRQALWGQGPLGSSLTMSVRRGSVTHEISLVRGLVRGFNLPGRLFESGLREYYQVWPDLTIHLVSVMATGDLVAYHAEYRGYNARYGRSAVWAAVGFVRIQQNKITDWWIVEDTFAQLKQLGYTIEPPAVVKG